MAGTGLTQVWDLTNTGRGGASRVGRGHCSGEEPSEVRKVLSTLKEGLGCGSGLMEEWCLLRWGQKQSQPPKILATGHMLLTPYNLHLGSDSYKQ